MMNSQSEGLEVSDHGHAVAAGYPAELLRRDVSRLEFVTVDQEADIGTEPDNPCVVQAHEDADTSGMVSAEEVAARIEAAKHEARRDAHEEWERELVARVSDERSAVLRTCEQFTRERARYFDSVESEVVQLALAIAARILHREVKLDPLLLTAAVRVALEKVADGSSVVVRVPGEDLALWGEVFRAAPDSGVELVGDDGLKAGECVLDTSVGKVELGVSAQLAEIERGFFDLLQQRPA